MSLTKKQRKNVSIFLDASQCASRGVWSERLSCFTTSSILYSFSHDRVINSDEMLGLLGYACGSVDTSDRPQSHVRHAVGEAMFLPNISQVLLAVWLNTAAHWWHRGPDEQ